MDRAVRSLSVAIQETRPLAALGKPSGSLLADLATVPPFAFMLLLRELHLTCRSEPFSDKTTSQDLLVSRALARGLRSPPLVRIVEERVAEMADNGRSYSLSTSTTFDSKDRTLVPSGT
jgi:hypothetical protein